MKKVFVLLSCLMLPTLAAAEVQMSNMSAAPTSCGCKRMTKHHDKILVRVTRDNPTATVVLPSNPSTGFSWFLGRYNSELITPVSQTYKAASTKLVGAPGSDTWVFQVKPAAFVVPQVIKIRMVYAKPFSLEGASFKNIVIMTTP